MRDNYATTARQLAGVTGTQRITVSTGVLIQVVVTRAIAGGDVVLVDNDNPVPATDANTVLRLPAGTPPQVIPLLWAVANGLSVTYEAGATGTINLKGFLT